MKKIEWIQQTQYPPFTEYALDSVKDCLELMKWPSYPPNMDVAFVLVLREHCVTLMKWASSRLNLDFRSTISILDMGYPSSLAAAYDGIWGRRSILSRNSTLRAGNKLVASIPECHHEARYTKAMSVICEKRVVKSRRRNDFRGYRYRAKADPRLQDRSGSKMLSSEELPDTELEQPIATSYFVGKRGIAFWKRAKGKTKSWRQCPLVKLNTKRQPLESMPPKGIHTSTRWYRNFGINSSFRPTKVYSKIPAILLRGCHKILAVSAGQLMRQTERRTLNPKIIRDKRKQINSGLEREILLQPVENGGKRKLKYGSSDFHGPLTPAQTYELQLQSCIVSNVKVPDEPLNHPLVFHYHGEVINCAYGLLALMEHLRNEPHGEVYAREDLNLGLKYEVKVYVLRGVPQSLRKRRVENLKKLTSLASFLYSFDHQDCKYCVFLPRTLGVEVKAQPSNLGIISRRNTSEYRKAFPQLSGREPHLRPNELHGPREETANNPSWSQADMHVLDVLREEISNSQQGQSDSRNQSLPRTTLAVRIFLRMADLDLSTDELSAIRQGFAKAKLRKQRMDGADGRLLT